MAQIDLSQTVALATAAGHRLRADAAASWDRMARAVAARYGWTPALTDSFRPYDVQQRIFLQRYVLQTSGGGYHGDVRYWQGRRYVRKKGTAAAAVPGTSNHGGGIAVDVSGLGAFGSTKHRQVADLADEHGWSNAEGRAVGEPWHWTYTGAGAPTPPAGHGRDITAIQRAVRATVDNIAGPDTRQRVDAVRQASRWAGAKFPYGIKYAQQVVGATPDGSFGPKSIAAHDATVAAIQTAVGTTADGIWGPATDAAVRALID